MTPPIPPDQAAADREYFLRMAAREAGRTVAEIGERYRKEELRDRAISMHKNESSASEIAEALGISLHQAKGWIALNPRVSTNPWRPKFPKARTEMRRLREAEALKLQAEGLDAAEIAERLGVHR